MGEPAAVVACPRPVHATMAAGREANTPQPGWAAKRPGPPARTVRAVPRRQRRPPGSSTTLQSHSPNRLRKTLKHTEKWARKSGVTCYRVYDADLPDYAVAVDVYNGSGRDAGKRWAHIAEYAPPPEIDPSKALSRLDDVLAIAPEVLGVDERDVFLKVRERQRGTSQYTRFARHGAKGVVEEGGLTFEVNFSDYLDTGIFLDHRTTRGMVRDMAEGQRFLNLFAYTGTASVYAAAGGATETTTVDMSATYTEWAGRNLAANGFGLPAHRRVQADVMKWLEAARAGGERYNLIFCDPPTFSNSKRMADTWDVQRDHVYLITRIAYILEAGRHARVLVQPPQVPDGRRLARSSGPDRREHHRQDDPARLRAHARRPRVLADPPRRRRADPPHHGVCLRRRGRLMTATALPPYTVRRSTKARLVRLTVTPRDGLVARRPRALDRRHRRDRRREARVGRDRTRASRREARAARGRTRRAAAGHGRAPRTRRGVAGGVPRDAGCGLQGAYRRRRDRGDRQHRRRRGVPRGTLALARPHGTRASCCRCSPRSRPRWSFPTPAPACATCARAGARARRSKTISLNRNLVFLPNHLVRTLMLHELAHTLVMDHSAKFWDTLAVYDRRAQINRSELKRAGQHVPPWAELLGARWACCETPGRWSWRRSSTSTPTTCLAERPRCRTSCCSRSRRCC